MLHSACIGKHRYPKGCTRGSHTPLLPHCDPKRVAQEVCNEACTFDLGGLCSSESHAPLFIQLLNSCPATVDGGGRKHKAPGRAAEGTGGATEPPNT
eukprot:838565-Pelagomonas_calceolata.AAC.1